MKTLSPEHLCRFLPVLACVGGLILPAQAADYYLHSNTPLGSNWNTLSTWFNQASGGGTNPSGMAGHKFFINGFSVRAGGSNFGGASLKSSVTGGCMVVQNQGLTLGAFNVTAQGSIALNAGGATYALNITTLNVSSTLNLRAPNTNGVMTLNVTHLNGSGNLVVGGGSGGSSPNASSIVSLSVVNADGFSGTVSPAIGTLTFGNAADFSFATLSLNGANTFSVHLANDIVLGSVVGTNFANGFSSLAAGQYSASELNAQVGAGIFTGSGKLTVVPAQNITAIKLSEQIIDSNGLNFPTGAYGLWVNNSGETKILTYNNYQYTTYYNSDRRVCVARRRISPPAAWQVVVFADYYFAGNDTHNTTQMGICRGDGTIHLAWDHHVSDLHYRKSAIGAATNPDQTTWNTALFSPITSSLVPGITETEVTYPAFIDVPNGNLQLLMRTNGGPGEADSFLYNYDRNTHVWTNGKILLSRQGTYDNEFDRSAYVASPKLYANVGGTPRFFLSWLWRERLDVMTNHDLFYAYSDDYGATWKNSAGTVAGESDVTPLRVDTPGLCAWTLPMNYALLNNASAAIDSVGQYHTLFSHAPTPSAPRAFYHYWRRTDGVWRQEQITGLSLNTSNKLQLLFGVHDNAYIVYQAAGDLRIAAASKASNWTDWSGIHSDNSRNYEQPSVDEARWAEEGILSVFVQQVPTVVGNPSPIYSIDFSIDNQP